MTTKESKGRETKQITLPAEYFCGKHRFSTNDMARYHIHIIDDHDTEHGVYQPVGDKR